MDILYQAAGVLNWGIIPQHQENFNKKSICKCMKIEETAKV